MTAAAKVMATLTAAVLCASCCVDALGLPPSAYEPLRATFLPVVVPTPTPRVTEPERARQALPTPTSTPRPRTREAEPRRGGIRGVATWYCKPGRSVCTSGFPWTGAYAAAGPELRAALGDWRGRIVWVNGVRVRLIDWCACGGDHVIDVYHSTWVTIPNPDSVVIRW